ncbi:hypothetical protein, partial [Lentibacillus populi]|uniref:hypothetical protein n=1 Tax=Lentibacillus populi TaxID=1827502 RepID=UPI00256FD215
MRKKVKEIENVFQSHGFSIDSIIQKVMEKFKFRSLWYVSSFSRRCFHTNISGAPILYTLFGYRAVAC